MNNIKISFTIIVLSFLSTYTLLGQDFEAFYKEGKSLMDAGENKKAIDQFSKALALNNEHINSYLQRGFLYGLENDYQNALGDFSEVLKLKPGHSYALENRALAYMKLGKHQLAYQDFNSIIQGDANNQLAYINRGFMKKELGDQKGACLDWKEAKKLGNKEAKIILKNNYCNKVK